MQKRTTIIISLLLCLVMLLAGCGVGEKEKADSDKLKVVCTLFPQYDFVRQIAGDRVELTLLLTPGTDSHSYDPSPKDIVTINGCSLFIYTGNVMESWAANVIKSVDTSKVSVLDVSKGIALSAVEHHDDEDAEHEEHDEHDEHEHSVDPHIWTSPINAKIMVESITAQLMALDSANAQSYRSAADVYLEQLDALDSQLKTIVSKAQNKEIIVCDRFAMHYFCTEYGLEYLAAFDSCTTDTEPSPAVIVKITDEVKAEKIPAVFYAELSNQNVAKAVAQQTGAKTLELHSCHNLSADDFSSGATYLSLMRQNAENLKIALGVS